MALGDDTVRQFAIFQPGPTSPPVSPTKDVSAPKPTTATEPLRTVEENTMEDDALLLNATFSLLLDEEEAAEDSSSDDDCSVIGRSHNSSGIWSTPGPAAATPSSPATPSLREIMQIQSSTPTHIPTSHGGWARRSTPSPTPKSTLPVHWKSAKKLSQKQRKAMAKAGRSLPTEVPVSSPTTSPWKPTSVGRR